MMIKSLKTSFEPIPARHICESFDQRLALINFETIVAGYSIRDRFTWPCAERSVAKMKLFAVNMLSDIFGPALGAFDPREIECKCFSF